MTRTRSLHHPTTGRRWGTRLEGTDLVTVTGAPGKEKESRKSQPDAFSAWWAIQQEERKRLRNGYVLVDPDPPAGAPAMLRTLDKSYTGAMPMLALGSSVLLCTSDASDGAEILLVDTGAEVEQVAKLPAHRLVHALAGRSDLGLLALVDHAVCLVTPSEGTVSELVAKGSVPASFLTISGTRAGWFDEPNLVVVDLESGEQLFGSAVQPTLYSGHGTQLQAELSADGAILAVCSAAGEIQLFDVDSQQPLRTIQGDFEMVSQMRFTPDGRWLLVKQRYGHWGLDCFDVSTGEPREEWPDLGDLGDADFAVDSEGRRLAIADQRAWVRVLDLATLRMQQEFQIDQVSKRFTVTWLGTDRIATRTDLGFVGVYPVSEETAVDQP